VEIRFRSGGALLAGTLSLPAAPGRHPGIALVHGSGATPRTDASVWAAYFESRGFAVLTYDKRGVAQSGGSYPGEQASPAAVDVYAVDAAAAARFLARQPEVDPARVGLSGASQAGWVMPLAASREPAVRFLVLVSGPVVTAGEQGTYQDLTTEGAAVPALSPVEILAEVRRVGPSGFDPLPSIESLRIPALWLLGSTDQHVPTALSVERLAPLASDPVRDLSYTVFPAADHFLLRNATGLASEDLTTNLYAPGLFATVDEWLARRGETATAPEPPARTRGGRASPR
jgi:dienelactone hydrolase